jgi:uncharacterized protein YndB with AHSA1/START domain
MQVAEKISTPASVETVWRILADLDRWKDWNPTIVEIVPLTAEGLRIGARYRVTQSGLRPAVYEVTDCTPNEAFTWVQKLPGGELIADHRIASRDGASQVELSFYSKGPLANFVTMLLSGKIREFVGKEARALKARCEATDSPSSP